MDSITLVDNWTQLALGLIDFFLDKFQAVFFRVIQRRQLHQQHSICGETLCGLDRLLLILL